MMNNLELKDFLSHHGVKGQKWGVRNAGKTGKGTLNKQKTSAQKLRNVKRVRNVVLTAVGVAYVSAWIASNRLNTNIRKGNAEIDKGRTKQIQTLNDMLKPKPKLQIGINELNDIVKKNRPFQNYEPPKNARQILMDQERQRNNAFQAKEMLKKMGKTVVKGTGSVGGSEQLHTDSILNKLYNAVGKIATDQDNLDRIFPLLDKIEKRRIKIGEITGKENDDWFDELLKRRS